MRIGSVVAPGPVVKLAMTKSSSESAKASIQLAAIAGKISGKVTNAKVCAGEAPRSIAASSRLMSKSTSRDWTITATKHVAIVVWAMTTVQNPRSIETATNKSNMDRPVMTSGMTNGAQIIAANGSRPRKRPNRTSATAARVPSNVAMNAEMKATRKLIDAARSNAASCASAAYQRIDQPPHTATRREALKE